RELGMEGGDQDRALARHHALATMVRDGRDRRAEAPDPGRPDEDHLERTLPRAQVALPHRLERLFLAAVRFALGRDVDESERELAGVLHFAREQDEAGARPEDRLARAVELLERGNELPRVEELEQRGALAPGHDETVHLVELP